MNNACAPGASSRSSNLASAQLLRVQFLDAECGVGFGHLLRARSQLERVTDI
jgi:hypothetical protein